MFILKQGNLCTGAGRHMPQDINMCKGMNDLTRLDWVLLAVVTFTGKNHYVNWVVDWKHHMSWKAVKQH